MSIIRHEADKDIWFGVYVDKAGNTHEGEFPVHARGTCIDDDACCIHNPSNHPLNDAPIVLRVDKRNLVERVCSHQILHPDPDALVFYKHLRINLAAHDCCPDKCCQPQESLFDEAEKTQQAPIYY